MNWGYIAGFFDGEGNLHTKPVKGGVEKSLINFLLGSIHPMKKY